ncbi:N-acetylmuramoyl-L-alanine amidase [Okeania sp.]|uniref:N-acetylmuramoyl-L-alanine amidase n=1 Tax=Okeania sp. TaxID=3100323 RepID=UPI002B4B0871|nr:N-acetylmuramoyl-L-alanine amidase [Okeania sp.]MEB3342432.1 N-acetylmuramoyl-L-alanine amidase [Okeania sp.]
MKNIYSENRLFFLKGTQMGKNLMLRWLLPSILSVFVLGVPSEATTLESWRFEQDRNQLSFTTQGGVQPKAQLVNNPTRLIIDLPGTTLGGVQTSQVVGGAIKAIRVGQFNPETARIVVELNNGYTIDPKEVEFQGISSSRWNVQIPTPKLITSTTNIDIAPQSSPSPSQNSQPLRRPPSQNSQSSILLPPRSPSPPRRIERSINQNRPKPNNTLSSNSTATNGTSTLVQDIEVTKEGIVLKTSGKLPEIELKQSKDRNWMTIDVLNATLTIKNFQQNQKFDEFGLTITRLTQHSTSPAVVRLTIKFPDKKTKWQARAYMGGIALWPEGEAPPTINQGTGFALINSLELKNGNELVITGDKPLNYTTGWDSETDAYGITIYNAKVDRRFRLPPQEVGSPLVWTKIRQEGPETVSILVKPATNVKIAEVTQITPEKLSLAMGWGSIGNAPPGWKPNPRPESSNTRPSPFPRRENSPPQNSRGNTTTTRRWPFPPPRRNTQQPNTNNSSSNSRFALPNQLPRRNGRLLIVIDPGHGGPTDLGGVGFNGIREKDIVLPISLEVAKILEQNNIQVLLTRETDRDLDLPPRAEFANRVGADLFVSIHANAISMSRPDVNGLETFYYESGLVLAQYIQNSMLQAFPTMNNRGVKQARFYVLRKTEMTAALVEVGFVTGNYDWRILADPAQRSRMAQAIARGILEYVKAYSR